MFFLSAANVFAQQPATLPSTQKWNTNGNVSTGSDFIGTTNATNLVFKTNNLKAFEIDPTGDLFIKKLAGLGDGLLKHDNNGRIERIPFNNSFTQVLSSNGVWKEISTFTGLEVSGNNIIQTTSGNFGIGTNSPQAKLDVNGSMKVSGELLSPQGIKFGSSAGIFYDNVNGLSMLSYGRPSTGLRAIPCAVPPSSWVNMFGGILQVYGTEPNCGLLNFQTWTGGSSIDASIEGNVGTGRLLLNYFCGNSTYINTGTNGGDVVMTAYATGKVGIGMEAQTEKLEIGNGNILVKGPGNFNATENEAFVFLGDRNHYIKTKRGTGVTINTYGAGTGIFLQEGTGNVGIGTDLTSNTRGYKLAVNGYIRAKEVVVETGWSDFVFAPSYKLMSLENVEKYIARNNHLPDVPSAEDISTNGLKVAEVQTIMMQKIEELTLYIIEQNKKLEELQTKIAKIEQSK